MPTLVNDEDCWQCLVTLTIELPESVSYISHLRQKVRYVIAGFGVSTQDAEDVEIIIGELATNAVRHAKGGTYTVSLELFQNQAVILVIDKGIGFLPDLMQAPGTERTEEFDDLFDLRIGGFGLPLVRSLSVSLDILPNKNAGMTVRAVKNLQPKL